MENKKKSIFEQLTIEQFGFLMVLVILVCGSIFVVGVDYYDYKFADKNYEVVEQQEILSISLQEDSRVADLIIETKEQTYAIDLVDGHLSTGDTDKNYFYRWFEPNKEKEVITIQLTNESFKKLSAEYAELYGKTLKKHEYSTEDYRDIFNTSNDMFNPAPF